MLGWKLINASESDPESKVHGANMGPIWGRQDKGGPHVGPVNFVFWEAIPVESFLVHKEECT